MNDEFNQITQSADREDLSLASRLKKTLSNTRSTLGLGYTVTPIAEPAPVEAFAAQMPAEEVPSGASENLLKLGIGLSTAGALISVIALLRRRGESVVVTPAPPVPTADTLLTKKVVAEEVSFAVPVSHDEVFVERRPAGDSAIASLTPIGPAEEVQIPLSEDQLEVQKQIVVTDEFTLGTHGVDGIAYSSDALRHAEPPFTTARDEATDGLK